MIGLENRVTRGLWLGYKNRVTIGLMKGCNRVTRGLLEVNKIGLQ